MRSMPCRDFRQLHAEDQRLALCPDRSGPPARRRHADDRAAGTVHRHAGTARSDRRRGGGLLVGAARCRHFLAARRGDVRGRRPRWPGARGDHRQRRHDRHQRRGIRLVHRHDALRRCRVHAHDRRLAAGLDLELLRPHGPADRRDARDRPRAWPRAQRGHERNDHERDAHGGHALCRPRGLGGPGAPAL